MAGVSGVGSAPAWIRGLRLEASPEGPARNYYRLSEDGEAVLTRINEVWDAMSAGVYGLRVGGGRVRVTERGGSGAQVGTGRRSCGASTRWPSPIPHRISA